MDFLDREGKKVGIKALFGDGKPGQIVILEPVTFSPDHPLAGYPKPYSFLIVEKVEGDPRKEGYYILMDADGNRVKIQDPNYGASLQYFYDANEFLQWNLAREKEEKRRQNRKEENQQIRLDLLKGIIEKQGIRVITLDQAKALGIVS